MAVTGVSNLAELISKQSLGNDQSRLSGSRLIPEQSSGAVAPAVDAFTPSSQNSSALTTAQDAGLFQVSQFVPASPAPVTTPGLASTSANTVAAAPRTNTNAQALGLPSTQRQLQSLNDALLGLGLTNSDIQAIDRIASTINNFNPTEYSDLVRQFQAQAAQQTANPASGNAPITVSKTEKA